MRAPGKDLCAERLSSLATAPCPMNPPPLRPADSLQTGQRTGWDLHGSPLFPLSRGCAWICNGVPAVTCREHGLAQARQALRFQPSASQVSPNDCGDLGQPEPSASPGRDTPRYAAAETAGCHAGITRHLTLQRGVA